MDHGDMTLNRMCALLAKVGGVSGALQLLRGELVISKPVKRWSVRDGVICITVTSNGLPGEQFVQHLRAKNCRLDDYASAMIDSEDFKPTQGVTTEVAILKSSLFTSKKPDLRRVRNFAARRKLIVPNAEIAGLLCETCSDNDLHDMGLRRIVVMHEPISRDFAGTPALLSVELDRLIANYPGKSDHGLERDSGFAFVVSQVVF